MDPNQYTYQCYYGYLQNQLLPTSENSQNPLQCIMYWPPHTNENSQNSPLYVMYPSLPHTSENS